MRMPESHRLLGFYAINPLFAQLIVRGPVMPLFICGWAKKWAGPAANRKQQERGTSGMQPLAIIHNGEGELGFL